MNKSKSKNEASILKEIVLFDCSSVGYAYHLFEKKDYQY